MQLINTHRFILISGIQCQVSTTLKCYMELNMHFLSCHVMLARSSV